jgi:hypothetical protein
MQLKVRFDQHRATTSGLIALLPQFHGKYGWDALKPAVEQYQTFLPAGLSGVKGEYDLWRHFWSTR